MPKQDRCADIKKDSQKAKKKAQAEQSKERAQRAAEEEQEQAEAAHAAAAAKATAKRLGGPSSLGAKLAKSSSTFAKASGFTEDNNSDDEQEYQPDEPAEVVEVSHGKGKKEPKESKKKQQAKPRVDDLQLLAGEQREAKRQRIISRLLRMLMIGFILDFLNGKNATKEKDVKQKKKGPNSNGKVNGHAEQSWSPRSFLQKVDLLSGPFFMLAFTVALMAARLAEEGYVPDSRMEGEANYYDVMGVPRDADMLSIRKAYKALALSWHPDKNPDCTVCPEKFAVISKAYETLNSPDRRKAYDQRRAPEGSLESMASVELTAEDFEVKVLRSNEIWVVQVYDPNEGLSKHFHPVWEDVAHTHRQIARFGRIDASKQRRALDYLPQRVVMMPLVFRCARGQSVDSFLWTGKEEHGSRTFSRFIIDAYPSMQRLGSTKEVERFYASQQPRVLVAGPITAPRKKAQTLELLQVQRAAHMWTEFAGFASAELKVVEEAMGSEFLPEAGASWVVVSQAGGAGGPKAAVSVQDLKDVPQALEELVARVIITKAPALTVRNHQQLCSGAGLGYVTRTFCLVLVDASGEAVAGALADLNASRSAYAQELEDLKASGEDAEEPFQIQPVHLATRNSRWPWEPSAVAPGFYAVWAEAKRMPAFVIELETGRIAAVKSLAMKDIYQQIAYEDLKFSELPEGASLVRGLPDPETSLRRELLSVLSSALSALLTYVLLAVAAAVLPELSLAGTGASLAGAFVLLLACWPGACRRFIRILWCMSSSSFECQGNI